MASRAHPDQRRLDLILEQIDALPTLSPVATRLLQVASAEDSDLQEIVRLIESDPALTSRILSLCRRASVGLPPTVNTVHKAVVMLGLEAVQAATLSVSIYELLETAARDREDEADGPDESAFDRVGYWKHALAVACAADLIAQGHAHLHVAPDEAFVAGLLHDIGKPVLNLVLPRAYSRVLRLAEERSVPSSAVERAVLGIDHHTAARRLATRWALPAPLVQVMWLYGQRPEALPGDAPAALIGVVSVAHVLARHLHIGFSGDFDPPPPLAAWSARFGIDAARVEHIVQQVHEQVAQRLDVLGLDRETSSSELLASIAAANRRLGSLHRALQQRARQAAEARRSLDLVASFLSASTRAATLGDVFGEIVRSAAGALGPGFFAIAHRLPGDAEWSVTRFAPSGRALETQRLDPPPHAIAAPCASLAGQVRLASMGLLPWLADCLHGAADLRSVRVLPLVASEHQPWSALLIHDRDPGRDLGAHPHMEALTAAWTAALAAALAAEAHARTSEALGQINRDLTDAQARLAEQESLARLGEMAAGAAHEMNNPLATICGKAELIAGTTREPDTRRHAEDLSRAACALSDLISALRGLADPPPCRPRAVDPATIVAEALAQAAPEPERRARVTVHPCALVDHAWLDPDLLREATAALIANALESSADARVDVHTDVHAPSGHLRISVRDNGPGMPPDVLVHAFDPFFSSKPAGRRTGLGLTRARRLVEVHGGTIRLESAPGEGTTAVICLPHWRSANSCAPDRSIYDAAGSGDRPDVRADSAA